MCSELWAKVDFSHKQNNFFCKHQLWCSYLETYLSIRHVGLRIKSLNIIKEWHG